MKEVISLHFGGAGVNIGKAMIEQHAKEHGIGPDGYFKDELFSRSEAIDMNHEVLFREDMTGSWTPRALFFDVESE